VACQGKNIDKKKALKALKCKGFFAVEAAKRIKKMGARAPIFFIYYFVPYS